MKTFLLSWNPRKSPGDFLRPHIERFRRDGRLSYLWRTIRKRNFPAGSRVLLIRVGEEPRGLIASGKTTREPYTAA
ncbi:MAG: hypothetical protein OJF52_003959 [Nitrospira sp.]|nr:MAG: hypothetical protein OJF52_003959 [Nitrospira sp.]